MINTILPGALDGVQEGFSDLHMPFKEHNFFAMETSTHSVTSSNLCQKGPNWFGSSFSQTGNE